MKKILRAIFLIGCLAISLTMFYHLYTQSKASNEHLEGKSVLDEEMDNRVYILYEPSGRNSHLPQNP